MTKAFAAAALCALAVAGCGSTSGSVETGTAALVPLKLGNNYETVKRKTFTIIGYAEPGAKVTVDGEPARMVDAAIGTFEATVRLDVGTNEFTVEASLPPYETATSTVTVTREKTAAEIKAEREAARRKAEAERKAREEEARRKAEAKAQREQSFKDSAESISYDELNKDADSFAGRKVKYTGQVFQIQQDGSNGGIMLLSVTDEGYGYWTDNVWVNYTGKTSANEDDIVTVYGTVVGSTSYETQIGGETYVPEIDAKYIE